MDKEGPSVPPPQYHHRFSGIPDIDNGIESLFDGEECEVEDSFIVVPLIPTRRTIPRENTENGLQSELNSSIGNHQEDNQNQVVPEPEPQPPEPPVLEKKHSFPIENGTGPPTFSNGYGDPGSETLFSTMSSLSSNDSTSLELANSQIIQLTEENTKLAGLLRQRNDELKRSIVLYNELKLTIESSDADAKKKLADAQKNIERLEQENSKLETQVKEITHDKELTEQRLIELEKEQTSLLDSLTIRNGELKSQLDLKNAELLEVTTALLKLSDLSDESGKFGLAKNEINSLQAQLTSLLVEKEELLKTLEDLKESHEKDDTTKRALLKDAIEQKELHMEQMEAYRSSYEEEHNERQSMQKQKENLEVELNKLQSALNEKTAELENLHKVHLELANEHINRGAVGGAAANTTPNVLPFGDTSRNPVSGDFVHVPYEAPGPEEILECPICARIFSRREILISHADKCGLKATWAFP